MALVMVCALAPSATVMPVLTGTLGVVLKAMERLTLDASWVAVSPLVSRTVKVTDRTVLFGIASELS
jgi:hypothetical protein